MSTKTITQIDILANGGTTYQVSLVDGSESEYLGSIEHEAADDDEIIEAAREQFGLDESVPASVR